MSQNYQNLNQFAQLPILGDTATKVNLNTLSVQIDPNSINTLLPGDAVYMTATAGTTILVDKCSATVAPFGYVLYNLKTDTFIAGDAVEIGVAGQIMYALAAGTITRGNNLEYDPSASLITGPQMLASGGVNPISALALDNATTGNLFRMIVLGVSYPVTATISGGFINNTPIGGTTPALGAFTVLTASTSLTVSGNTTTTTLYDAIVALATTATISLNPALGGLFTLTPTQSCTINAASVPAKHQRIVINIVTSGTVAFTVTFGSNFKSTGTLSTGTVNGTTFIVGFEGNGTNFCEVSRTGI
jgi:hypothetical protein